MAFIPKIHNRAFYLCPSGKSFSWTWRNIIILFAVLCALPQEIFGTESQRDEIAALRHEIQSLESQLKSIHDQEAALHDQERQLSEKIRRLKEDSRQSPGLLLEIRIQNSLRDFRDLLLSIKRLEEQEQDLYGKLSAQKSHLREVLSQTIDQQVQAARELYSQGREKEADEVYLQALTFMEEYRKLSRITLHKEDIPEQPDPVELPLFSGQDPEQLMELAILLRDDADLIRREIFQYTDIQNQLAQEKKLLERLMGFQGIIERGDPSSDKGIREIHQERQRIENDLHFIQNRLSAYRQREKRLREQSQKLEQMAEERRRALIGPKKD